MHRVAAYARQYVCKVCIHPEGGNHDLGCHEKTRQRRDQREKSPPEAAQLSTSRGLAAPMSAAFPAWFQRIRCLGLCLRVAHLDFLLPLLEWA